MLVACVSRNVCPFPSVFLQISCATADAVGVPAGML